MLVAYLSAINLEGMLMKEFLDWIHKSGKTTITGSTMLCQDTRTEKKRRERDTGVPLLPFTADTCEQFLHAPAAEPPSMMHCTPNSNTKYTLSPSTCFLLLHSMRKMSNVHGDLLSSKLS